MGFYSALALMLIIMAAGWMVQRRFKSRFKKYARLPLRSGLSGHEVARRMLEEQGISGVQIKQGRGMLTDHYNPLKKSITLSPEVYEGRTIAAAAVAAHETGHAVQHARQYAFLQMRSALVPVVSFSSNIVHWLLLIGIFTLEAFPQLMLAGIVLFAATTLFSFITLPVEFDASNRALQWLEGSNVTNSQELTMAKDALWWAAMTYVIAALASLATLAYYVMIYMSRR